MRDWIERIKDRLLLLDLPRGNTVLKGLGALAVLLALYYPVGMAIVHRVDDDPAFTAPETAGGSRAVDMAIALIDREVNINRWTANDPFFLPGAALDNMPNFQQGVISALARFSFELTDQLGRVRGSSSTDPDLQKAAGLLQYPGNVWVWDPSVSWAPTATSEQQYREALKRLRSYNERLSRGEAIFERRGDNLMATLDRIALDLGAASAALDQRIREGSGLLIDTQADDVFYHVKGQTYAYYLLLKALQVDFANVVQEKELTAVWERMLSSMQSAAILDPLIVINAGPDAWIRPSHLAAQGFYLLRARTQLREITNILLK